METPKTYTGYGEDGQVVISKTSEDANNYLNPAEVQKAVEHIGEVAEEQAVILRKATYHLRGEADHALIISATDMSDAISDITDIQERVVEAIKGSFVDVYDNAVKAHDEIQRKLNEQMRQYVSTYPGVVR